ncbi:MULTISPECIES: hypothetical protein [Sphingobium]|uniref:hypothetical protein n=1 Tax=Sphingobium sp. TA15 TaxID=2905832 RepID=UPI00059B9B17|nr:hypothetical protein [Sphingobium indicum]
MQRVTAHFMIGEFLDAIDIDDHLGLGETEIHHRDQALAPRKYLGRTSINGEELKRLVDRVRSLIFKRCWFHSGPLRAGPPVRT